MAEIEFYRDKKGAACARGEDQRLATFLQTDLQESEQVTKDLMALLADGQVRSEFNGNGHCVTISRKMATIESNFDEEAPDRRLERKHLLAALRKWLKFIQT
jgi:hypothetical protein